MLKYTETLVGFSEVPEEITLCINISGCPIHCVGCHSPHLWNDIGEELKPVVLSNLIAKNQGITCIAFMGGDAEPDTIVKLAKWVKKNTELKVCWYSGRTRENFHQDKELMSVLDYIKIGPYKKELGGLDNLNTNQRFYKITTSTSFSLINIEDITPKFRKNK